MSNTPIELLHDYHNITKFLEPSKRDALRELLQIQESDLRRVGGLEAEDEFKLMIYSLQWVKSASGIEEGTAKVFDTTTDDLFVETLKGKKLCIEIKSTKDDSIRLKESLVREKIEYATSYSCECYFAIRLMGHWLLLSAQYVLDHDCKISIDSDYFFSELNELFGERLFLFPKGMSIITTYSKKEKAQEGITGIKTEYGKAIRIAIKVHKKNKFIYTKCNKKNIAMSFIIEAVEDAMSNQFFNVIEQTEDATIVVEELQRNIIVPFSHIMMMPVKHMNNPNFAELETFTPSTYLEEIKKHDGDYFPSREYVLNKLLDFYPEYPIYISFNSKEFVDLKSCCVEKEE